ncbi:MAG TPA: BTAD domain-containing putative transcriptional regulator [Roseiflexaceae bacterium]
MSEPITRIALFGALEITHGAAAPRRPPTQRVLALLGYLIAHHDIPQRRDKLVDLLWPDLPPRQGRRMLSDTLWRARRLLTPPGQGDTTLLAIAGDAITFRPDPSAWVDLVAFEQALAPRPADAADDVEPIRAAVELYRGDLLEDCYDDWALYERERRREQYMSALHRLLAHDQARQAYDRALQSALRLAQADPLREEVHRALMRLYHLLGRTEDALCAFEQCRAALLEELGVEPEAETLSLYEELAALQQRRASAARAAEAPGAAILQDVPLVGRADVRAEVIEAVEQALAGMGGLLLVAGAAGQGKSRLLREVAAGAEWRGAQVSWGRGREDVQAQPFGALREALLSALTPLRARQLADLVPAHTLDALLPLLPEIAALLPDHTFSATAAGDQAARLYGALTGLLLGLGQIAPQVLLLEDLHWFDAATLEALAAVAPALRDARVLLVMSGRAEDLAGRAPLWDALLRIDRSGLLRQIELSGLSEAEVAELVRRALRMRHPAPRFSARLAAATGGNPFFILEALRALHAQGALARDAQGVWHTSWDGPGADYRDLPLPQGLRQAIDERVRVLAPPERAALAAAAVLGTTFSPAALARMTYEAERPTDGATGRADERASGENDVAPSLQRPVAPSQPITSNQQSSVTDQLLRRQFLAEDGAGYRFEHELLREVIYDRLDGETRQALHLRAAEALEHEHYARVEALAQHLYLAEAWEKAAPYLIQAGARARTVCAYRDALRNYDQAAEAVERSGGGAANLATLWDIQLRRGAVATPLGDYAAALEAYGAVLRLTERDASAPDAAARAGARRSAQIQALSGMCYVHGLRNDYEQAQSAIRLAADLAGSSPRLFDRAEVFYHAGMISFRRDDYGEARRLLQEALRLYDALDLPAERAKCLIRIAWSAMRQDGPVDNVIEHFTQAIEIYRQQGDRFSEHLCLVDIASAQLMRGRLAEALAAIEGCLPFFSSLGALDEVPACLYTRGETLRRMGRLDEALQSLRETVALCTRLDRTAAAEFAQVSIAAALCDQGRYDEALQAIERPVRSDDRRTRARALLVAADVCVRQSQIERAWAYLDESFTLARWLGARAYLGVAYRLLAQLRIADRTGCLPAPAEDAPDAATSLAESVRLLRAAHADDDLALTYLTDGVRQIAAEHPVEARAALVQAHNLMARCGMIGALEQTRRLLQSLPAAASALRDGQRRVLLARRGVPRGRPLRSEELVEVVWTVDVPEEREVGQPASKATARQQRLLHLCAEALAQNAEPTVGDLAGALGVTTRTVDRDIAALRAAGAALATRGGSG